MDGRKRNFPVNGRKRQESDRMAVVLDDGGNALRDSGIPRTFKEITHFEKKMHRFKKKCNGINLLSNSIFPRTFWNPFVAAGKICGILLMTTPTVDSGACSVVVFSRC